MRFLKGTWEVTKIVGTVLICAIIIRSFIVQPFVVEGSSMEPNYHNNEYLLIEKLSFHFRNPQRGEVLIFRYPNDTRVNYIKRVIGLPGETVKIENGKVYINDAQLEESYLPGDKQTLVESNPEVPYVVTLRDDQYFMMGDNRDHSSDSRSGWLLSKKYIIGKSVLILYKSSSSASASYSTY